jgi:hypothetical protein
MNLRILAPDYLNDNSFTMRKQMHVCLEEKRMRRGNAKEDLSWHLLGVSGEMKEVFRMEPDREQHSGNAYPDFQSVTPTPSFSWWLPSLAYSGEISL